MVRQERDCLSAATHTRATIAQKRPENREQDAIRRKQERTRREAEQTFLELFVRQEIDREACEAAELERRKQDDYDLIMCKKGLEERYAQLE
jgi:hypothetical protein